jgi:hypothetical protein
MKARESLRLHPFRATKSLRFLRQALPCDHGRLARKRAVRREIKAESKEMIESRFARCALIAGETPAVPVKSWIYFRAVSSFTPN